MKLILGLFILGTIANSAWSKSNEDISWRDFDGTIPDDAFPAGGDSKGRMYIGQVLYKGKIIPGKLYKGDKNIYFEYEEEAHKAQENIKILCTKHPEYFVWHLTKNSDYKRIKHLDLVKGGFQQEFKTYIGLIVDGGEPNIGKVICKESECLALYTVKDGKNIEYHTYYILAYVKHKKQV